MDLILENLDHYALDSAYAAFGNYMAKPELLPYLERANLVRQSWTLFWAVSLGGLALYLATATFRFVAAAPCAPCRRTGARSHALRPIPAAQLLFHL